MKKIITLTLLLSALFIYAQPGSIDPTFNPTDNGSGAGIGADEYVYSMAIQQNGKIIINGGYTTYNGSLQKSISRLNTDGTLDNSFTINEITGLITTTLIQADGKIIIGGSFTSINNTPKKNIARLNADGTLDTSFISGTGANQTVFKIITQIDGKIIISGDFTTYNGVSRNRIARLNIDGSLDTTFDLGTGANGRIIPIAIQSNEKIIIGGDFTTINGITRNRIAQLNTDGSLDTSFDPGTGLNSGSNSIAVQLEGKIIIGGNFTTFNDISQKQITRLNADGSLDTSFNIGIGTNSTVNAISTQSDGKIVIGGTFTTYNGISRNGITRLNTDGSLDTSFSVGSGTGNGNVTSNRVYCSAILTDGKIIIGGDFTSYNGTFQNRIARLNSNGSLDSTFNPSTAANNAVLTTAIQADGKSIIGGHFSTYNGVLRNRIARLNLDGSVDTSFNFTADFNYTKITATALQQNGKIIVLGSFTNDSGQLFDRIFRLNTNGSLDTSFLSTSGEASTPLLKTIVIQSDDKILLGGDFTSYRDIPRSKIARLNADGTLDTGFDSSIGISNAGYVNSVAIEPDGKIIVGGFFSDYNGNARNKIARLNANGSLDTSSFNSGFGVGNGEVNSISLQSDGKIIIVGNFLDFNSTSRNRIARLKADGSLDTNFNLGTGASSRVVSISIQPDDKIIIGGYFTSYNGIARSGIARLNADGSLDTGFNVGSGVNSIVATTSIQSDGKIVVGGYFTNYNGFGKNRIIRINGNTNTLSISESNNIFNSFMVYPNPSSGLFYVKTTLESTILSKVEVKNSLGQTLLSKANFDPNQALNLNNYANGLYFIQITSENKTATFKVLKQ